MTAPTANVFGPVAANLVDCDEVAEQDAGQRVPDHYQRSLCFDKGVPAQTRVFSRFGSPRHHMDAMTKKPACIANSFFEVAMVWIPGDLEQQRVSALFANVLMVGCTRANRGVVMLAEKAGQFMSDP